MAAAALAAAAFAAAPASADIQLIHTQLDSHFATLTNNQTNQSYYVYDAPVTFTAYNTNDPSKTPYNFLAFCVDLYHDMYLGDLNPGGNPVGYTYHEEDLRTDSKTSDSSHQAGTNLTNMQLKQISALLNFAASEQALSPLQRQHEITDELATVQAAIWKVENPTWTIAPSNAWVAANVDSYIAQAGHTPLMPVGVMKAIYANNYSTQAFAFGGGVPEPATWGLMIVGFGAIGAVLRRRRAAAALA